MQGPSHRHQYKHIAYWIDCTKTGTMDFLHEPELAKQLDSQDNVAQVRVTEVET